MHSQKSSPLSNIFVVSNLFMILFLSASVAMAGGWIADEKGCKAWDRNPESGEVFEWSGLCKDGYLEGPGILKWYSKDDKPTWYRSGKPYLTIKGEWIGGKMNGKIVNNFSAGSIFEADYVDNEIAGKGVFKGVFVWKDGNRYEGDFVGNDRTGKGVFTRPNGNRYEGDFVDNVQTGKGLEILASGTRYKGDFVAGNWTGKGVVTYADGDRYVGDFVDNEMTGKGTKTYADGSRYEGAWVKNSKHGYGILQSNNGDRLEGIFNNGVLKDGKERKTDSTGAFEGTIKEGKRERGIYSWSDGDRYEGAFVNGNRTGKGVFSFANGDRYEGDFVEGERTGKGVYTWADGSRYEGDFVNKKMTGKGKFYLSNSNNNRLIYDGEYVNGNWDGFGVYYYNNAKYTGHMKNNKFNGKGTLVFNSGDVHQGDFIEGKRHGQFNVRYDDGTADVVIFKNDEPISSRNEGNARGLAALAIVFGGIGKVVEGVGNAMSSAGSGSPSGSYSNQQYQSDRAAKDSRIKICKSNESSCLAACEHLDNSDYGIIRDSSRMNCKGKCWSAMKECER